MKTWHLVLGSLALNYLSYKYVNSILDNTIGKLLP
jgi:hypothetical protein